MSLATIARLGVVFGAVLLAAASASSNRPATSNAYSPPGGGGPPPPRQMDGARALGVWRSTFGAVKIEPDANRGGLGVGAVHGVWTYQRNGQWIDGYFWGELRGNVMSFRWQEPNTPPLTGEGYLVFDESGRQYSGRWWSDRRDRVGQWNGWRDEAQGAPQPTDGAPAPYSPAPATGPAPAPYGPQQPGSPPASPTYGPDQPGSNPSPTGYGPPQPRPQPAPGSPSGYGPQPPAQKYY